MTVNETAFRPGSTLLSNELNTRSPKDVMSSETAAITRSWTSLRGCLLKENAVFWERCPFDLLGCVRSFVWIGIPIRIYKQLGTDSWPRPQLATSRASSRHCRELLGQ